MRLRFTEPDAGEFGIGKQAIWNLPAGRHTVAARQVGMHHAEIVQADVGELRAAGNFADGPNAGCRRLKALVDLDVTTIGQIDARQLQAEPLGVGSAAGRNQNMAAR